MLIKRDNEYYVKLNQNMKFLLQQADWEIKRKKKIKLWITFFTDKLQVTTYYPFAVQVA